MKLKNTISFLLILIFTFNFNFISYGFENNDISDFEDEFVIETENLNEIKNETENNILFEEEVDLSLDNIVTNELISSKDEIIELNLYNENSRARAITPLLIKLSYSYNKTNKEFDFIFNIDAPTTLIKPKLDSAKITIEKSTTKSGTYTKVGNTSNWSNISYLSNYKKSIAAETGHYKVYIDINPASGVAVSNGNGSAYYCLNRTGNIWVWSYTDSVSGKTMSEPNTNLTKKALYSRPSNLNLTYKNWYDITYKTNLNLDKKQVHHIRPLAYGGDNTMGNLIHLDTDFHTGVTAWWAGY